MKSSPPRNKIFTNKFSKKLGKNYENKFVIEMNQANVKKKVRSHSSTRYGFKSHKDLLNNEKFILSKIKFFSDCILPKLIKIKSEKLKKSLWEYYEFLNHRKETLQKKKINGRRNKPIKPKKQFKTNTLNIFGNWDGNWSSKVKNIIKNSPHGHFKSLKIRAFVTKAADDMRQEMLALQLIKIFNTCFEKEDTSIKVKSYDILLTGQESGWIDYLSDTISVDALKKRFKGTSLPIIFKQIFADRFEEAQKNFIESFAGGSLISYFMSLRDRHNGNLLIDNRGHIFHIDFGFMLGSSPGNVNLESAPFKFTEEYMDLIGGMQSGGF